MRKSTTLLLIAALVAIAAPAAASADAVFKTQHLRLTPLGDAPLRSGFVQQIHANGPVVYGTDAVVLNGARPETAYVAVMFVSPFDPTCESEAAPFAAVDLSTNRAGNGRGATGIIPPEAIPEEARGHMHGSTGSSSRTTARPLRRPARRSRRTEFGRPRRGEGPRSSRGPFARSLLASL